MTLRGRRRPSTSTACPPATVSTSARLTLDSGHVFPRAHLFAFRFTGPGLFQASGVAIVR